MALTDQCHSPLQEWLSQLPDVTSLPIELQDVCRFLEVVTDESKSKATCFQPLVGMPGPGNTYEDGGNASLASDNFAAARSPIDNATEDMLQDGGWDLLNIMMPNGYFWRPDSLLEYA